MRWNVKLTPRQLYDYHDIDPWELKLIRVGHALWGLLRAERRALGYPLREERLLQRGLPTHWPPPTSPETESLEAAIQIIVGLKRAKRAELKAQRAAESQKLRERFELAASKGARA
jgi:hypothetical protein